MTDLRRTEVSPAFKEPRPSKRERAKTKAEYVSAMKARMRTAVFDRDGGCVLHGERWAPAGEVPPCFGDPTVHHRRKASDLGSYTMDNLVTLCAFHNNDIENHEDWVRANYPWLIVRAGDDDHSRLGRRGWRG